VSVGAVLMLDGGASTCADGAIANWIWDFDATTDTDPTGDWNKNGIFNEPHDDNDAEGQTVLFPTNTPGQYIVVLTVWSDHHEMHHPDHWETDQDTILVTVIDDFQIVDLLITDAICNGQNNGSAELILAGGQEPYTILWSNGQTGNPAIGLGAGSYSVTATDAMGVEVTQSFQISQPTPIEVAAEYTLPVCPFDPTGVISLTAQGGLPPYDYFWNTNDTGPTLSGVPAGIYFAFVIDAFGCVHTESFTLEASDNVPPVIIANDATVSLDPVTGTAIMQPSAFISQISDNCQIAGVNLTPLILGCSNIGPNTITIAAIDDSGNITVVQVVATIVDDTPPQMSPVNITLPLGADGTVTADPELLSGGSFDNCGIESLTIDIDFFDCGDVGDHLVVLTATDGSGNSSSAPAVITVVDNTPPTVITQNITVSLNANGQGFIVPSDLDGGSIDNCGILVLQASQTSYSCADLASGGPIPVTLTLYDISGNMGTGLAFVTVVDTIPPTIACPDDIVIPFCAPVTFDPPVADDNCDFSVVQTEGLPSGGVFPFGLTNQEFTATDTYGNTASCSFIVTVENDLNVEAEITHVSCNGLADGTIDIAVSGGTQPYLYFWSGGGNTNLSSGIYQVTILDANGCESVRTYVVNEPNPLVLSVVNLQNETNGQGDGAFTLVVSGGTGPYTYEGTTFDDSLRVEDLSAGVYNLTLTDANGCTISASAEIQNISGVGEPQALRAFAVYPNPAGAFAVVDIRFSQASQIQLSLSDASGRTIQTWEPPVAADQLNLRIELDEAPPGMYTLKLVAEDGVAVRKLIKN
jgi:large repetitive protein